MAKDYHKGVRLQVYIPKELNDRMDAYIKHINNFLDDVDDTCIEKLNKTGFIKSVINDYLREHDINS